MEYVLTKVKFGQNKINWKITSTSLDMRHMAMGLINDSKHAWCLRTYKKCAMECLITLEGPGFRACLWVLMPWPIKVLGLPYTLGITRKRGPFGLGLPYNQAQSLEPEDARSPIHGKRHIYITRHFPNSSCSSWCYVYPSLTPPLSWWVRDTLHTTRVWFKTNAKFSNKLCKNMTNFEKVITQKM